MPRYIEKRRRKWYAILDIPKDLIGKIPDKKGKRLVQSLETESETEALRVVMPVVAAWKKMFIDLRSSRVDPEMLEWKQTIAEAEEDIRDIAIDLLRDRLEEEVRKNQRTEEEASEFYKVAAGHSTPLMEHVDAYLAEKSIKEKTRDMARSTFFKLSHTHKSIEAINRKEAGAYISKLLKNQSGKTIRRTVGNFRGYWRWIISRELVLEELINPWTDHEIPTTKKIDTKPFTDSDLKKIIKEIERKKDEPLRKLAILGMYTGCRIEELCSLPLKHVNMDEGYFEIEEAKTDAGNRKVPIHSRIVPLVEKLLDEAKGDYLISGLTVNKYKDRSNAIGKRFGHVKSDLGYLPRVHTFHSIRGSMAQKFKDAGVVETTAADTLGHKYRTMTYGLYSAEVDLRIKKEALKLVDYKWLAI